MGDTWSSKSLASDGTLVPGPTKWPNGIAAVAIQIYGKGLKMGQSVILTHQTEAKRWSGAEA